MSPPDAAPNAVDTAVSDALHVRARAFVAAFTSGDPMPEAFDALACDIARFQAAASPGYARLCRAKGVDPTSLTRAIDIPSVPTDAFKLTRVATFPPEATRVTFRTSGTTIGARGAHAMRDVATYDAAAIAFGRHWLARDVATTLPIVVLGPSPSAAPDSSLTHMCERFVATFGEPASVKDTFVVDGDVFDVDAFDSRVSRAVTRNQAVLVLATSFALVHFLDALGDDVFPLPAGSRVMQTGGFKGKSREVDAETLRRDVARVFAIEPRAVVSEYGMTELSSQFYEKTLFDPSARHGVLAEPPWARIEVVDPETLAPVTDGTIGIASIVDLMNVDSAVVVLTQDRVRRTAEGVELLGRSAGAPPRGCSIGIDELLSQG